MNTRYVYFYSATFKDAKSTITVQGIYAASHKVVTEKLFRQFREELVATTSVKSKMDLSNHVHDIISFSLLHEVEAEELEED